MTKDTPLILIVEDEDILNEAYQTILRNQGYNIITAYNGKEAMEVLKDKEPDLILLDLRMPEMDGVSFLKEYDLSQHPNVKVVVFSNFDMQREVDEAYELGAKHYILKSGASPKELVHIVKRTLAEK